MITDLSTMSLESEIKEEEKENNIVIFDITLEPSECSATQNYYANCYCYGPAYPPCCG